MDMVPEHHHSLPWLGLDDAIAETKETIKPQEWRAGEWHSSVNIEEAANLGKWIWTKIYILPLLEECHLCCISRIQLDMIDIPVYDAAENKTERKSSNAWLSILIG